MSGLEETSDSIVDLRAAAQVPTVQGELSASSESGHAPKSSSHGNQLPPSTSLFGLFQHPDGSSGLGSPPPGASSSPSVSNKSSNKLGGKPATKEKLDVKAEVIEGIKELLDELDQVDTQIADFALDHINSNETILTHTSSQTVQKFLLTAAKKRKFTVIHAEAYPNDHEATHATILHGGYEDSATGGGVDPDDLDDDNAASRWKPLTSLGIQVILIPDSAVFALMSRINKVLLAPNAILADGSLLAAAGAASIAQAAQVHHVPVVVLGGVYKLSPVYPFSSDEMIEYGDPGKVVPYGGSGSGEFLDKVDVVNPLYDWTPAEAVDLYITNLGGHAPSYLYRIVDDHYYAEDTDLVTRG
jgi:translation initiation factor eIF-2B subunit beta